MTPRHSFLTRFVLVSAAGALSLPGLSEPPERAILSPIHTILPTQTKKAPTVQDFGRLPLSFESNRGQTDARVRFLTHTSDSALFLTPAEAVFRLDVSQGVPQTPPRTHLSGRRSLQTGKRKCVALRMQIVGANPRAIPLQQQPLAGRVNYFAGKDPDQWHAGVPTFGKVGFQGVYPGIDLVYYGNQQHLEYDFVVAPHADPKQIQLHFAGAQGVHINGNGDLVVRTQGRELKWQRPVVYQQDAAGKHSVAARFRLKKLSKGQTGVCFALGRYNAVRPLIIDPVLLYSTYLGGSGNTTAAFGIAIDSGGNAYITGHSYAPDFPTTAGVFQPGNGAQAAHADNAFVTKLNPTGTALLYSTYLGGSGVAGSGGGLGGGGNSSTGDAAACIAVDSNGNAYIAGYTTSADFPTTAGAFQRVNNAHGTLSTSAFVAKLNATGTALLYSTYLGGSGGNFSSSDAAGIAIDSSGDAFVAGYTTTTDFPTTPTAFQRVNNAGLSESNGFVTKLNPGGTALLYSTYLGGSGASSDGVNAIALDSSGNAYVVGVTRSTTFPTTPNAFQAADPGLGALNGVAFVTKLDTRGTTLLYSTYLGGSGNDAAYGIALDSSGNAYVTGFAGSSDFPTTSGAFQRIKSPATFSHSAFVTKLNASGTALVYSTYLAGFQGAEGRCIAIDSSGNAYVAGLTGSTDFPTTPGAFQRVINVSGSGWSVPFVTKLNAGGTALLYSTYLSGSNASFDQVSGIAIDSNGVAYIAGTTSAADFPTTPGTFQSVKPTFAGLDSAFVARLSPVSISPDFNNDGHTDLLLQNPATGEIGSWFLQGSTKVGGAAFSLTPPVDFALVGVGDFSGDGSSTLVLQSKTTHQIAFWFTSGANHAVIPGGHFVNTTPDAAWKVVGVGDFNSDGKSDLVFQNQTTGQIVVWFMNGYVVTGGVLLPYSPVAGWRLAGVGDLNADGFTDLLFQNQTSGQLAVWYLSGTNYVSGTVLTAVPGSDWSVAGVGDYNGDGFADLLFTNPSSNLAVVWYLQNGNFVGGDALSASLPTGWTIVGPR